MKYLIFVLFAMLAGEAFSADRYYDRKEEGWFFYNEEIQEEPEQPEEKPEPPPAPPVERVEVEPVDQEPPAMSVAWFRENFEKIQNRAIDNPTRENVAAFYAVHQQMISKSTEFARVGQQVLVENPDLDPRVRFSNSISGEKERQKAATQMLTRIFERLKSQNGGVWFFYDNSNVSRQMVNAMIDLVKDFDVDVLPIGVNGAEAQLADMRGANLLLDPIPESGLVERLSIGALPAVALAIPPDRIEVVGYGTLSRGRLHRRIPSSAKLLDLISETEYRYARGELEDAPNAARRTDLGNIKDSSSAEILRALREARQ